jgi:cytidylate kinase
MIAKGMNVTFDELKKMISARDIYDSSRKNSPLRIAEGATQIDTSNLSIIEQTNMIIELAEKIIKT